MESKPTEPLLVQTPEPTTELAAPIRLDAAIMERIVTQGDLAGLNPEQRVAYYNYMCQRCGVDPASRPFEYLKLNNKIVLYARRDCTDQLRVVHGVSVVDMRHDLISDQIYQVTVKVQNAKGRTDMGTGAVNITLKRGDDLANAIMKAETKAKRRATLSICGMGMMDETELETIPELKAEIPEESTKAKLEAFLGGNGKANGAPLGEPQPDLKADAATRFTAAVQGLSDRDVKGWKITAGDAADIYRQVCELGAPRSTTEAIAWMNDRIKLTVVDVADGVQILASLRESPK